MKRGVAGGDGLGAGTGGGAVAAEDHKHRWAVMLRAGLGEVGGPDPALLFDLAGGQLGFGDDGETAELVAEQDDGVGTKFDGLAGGYLSGSQRRGTALGDGDAGCSGQQSRG